MSTRPRTWNIAFGILLLVNAVILLMYLVFSSSLTYIIFDEADIAVWGNYPEYFDNILTNSGFGLIFAFANVGMLILIAIFGGLMKSHYQAKKLTRFWNKMIMAAVLSLILIVFNFFYDKIRMTAYYKYIVDLIVSYEWDAFAVRSVYYGIFDGAWGVINAAIGLATASNFLWAWLNFRSFAKEHLDKQTSVGALLLALGFIPQLLGLILQIGVFTLNIDWILYNIDDTFVDWALLPIVESIGADGFVTLNFLSAGFVVVLPYLFSVVGSIIIGIRFIVANEPHPYHTHTSTEEPTLETFHATSSTQQSRSTQVYRQQKQSQQREGKWCGNCGNKLPPHVSFCPFCGTALKK